ncbi:AAA family ATPase [Larkinella ripae]
MNKNVNYSGLSAFKPERTFSSKNIEEALGKAIVTEAGRLQQVNVETKSKEEIDEAGLLMIKPANRWMQEASQRATPKMLFDQFWFEGQVVIVFADSGVGKSILAVQIADSISTGRAINGFKMTAGTQKVLCCDFELSDKQFQDRYSIENENLYQFHDNFMRAELNPEWENLEGKVSFEDQLIARIEEVVVETGVKAVIVDNLTYLRQDNEQAKDALSLMKKLIGLKKRYGLSILILAHTPKRHPGNPLTQNDLAGSKMLVNFCDGAFAIGSSIKDPSLRYIKEIKQRNTDIHFGDNNVIVCQVAKEASFLGFKMIEYGREQEHLRASQTTDVEERKQLALELHEQGMSNVQIGKILDVSESMVRKYLKK